MYIDRKRWNIPEINILLNLTQENSGELVTTISREISFSNEVKERLLQIAEKCPVSKILKNQVIINTTL